LAFAEAVHALTAEPTSANVVRYLIASRNLDKVPRADAKLRQLRVRTASP
jgi:hypothetical protein